MNEITRSGRRPRRFVESVRALWRELRGVNGARMLLESGRGLRRVRVLSCASMLLAMQVALGLVASINLGDYIRISFGYLALAVNAMLFGPAVGALAGALSDLVVFVIRPTGAYFPGFTLSAALVGMVYGFVLYGRAVKLRHIVFSQLVISLLIHLLLNSLWLKLLYGKDFFVLVRLVKQAAQFPVDAALLVAVLPLSRRAYERLPLERGR